jgi:hypothetical protein
MIPPLQFLAFFALLSTLNAFTIQAPESLGYSPVRDEFILLSQFFEFSQ